MNASTIVENMKTTIANSDSIESILIAVKTCIDSFVEMSNKPESLSNTEQLVTEYEQKASLPLSEIMEFYFRAKETCDDLGIDIHDARSTLIKVKQIERKYGIDLDEVEEQMDALGEFENNYKSLDDTIQILDDLEGYDVDELVEIYDLFDDAGIEKDEIENLGIWKDKLDKITQIVNGI